MREQVSLETKADFSCVSDCVLRFRTCEGLVWLAKRLTVDPSKRIASVLVCDLMMIRSLRVLCLFFCWRGTCARSLVLCARSFDDVQKKVEPGSHSRAKRFDSAFAIWKSW